MTARSDCWALLRPAHYIQFSCQAGAKWTEVEAVLCTVELVCLLRAVLMPSFLLAVCSALHLVHLGCSMSDRLCCASLMRGCMCCAVLTLHLGCISAVLAV